MTLDDNIIVLADLEQIIIRKYNDECEKINNDMHDYILRLYPELKDRKYHIIINDNNISIKFGD